MGFFSKRTNTKSAVTRKSTGNGANNKSRFRGVQINTNGDDCCRAVNALAGKRFLSNNVPMLPLDECDAAECRCTYQLFDDRRTDTRRAGDVSFDIASQLYEPENRRVATRGRRNDD